MKGHMTQTKTEERNIKITNPYSGQSEMLTQSEAIHYHMIKKFEELEAKIKELEAKNVKKLPNKKAA